MHVIDVFMYVYTHEHVHIHTHADTYTHVHARAHAHTQMRTHMHTHAHMHTHKYTYTYTCTHVWLSVCKYVTLNKTSLWTRHFARHITHMSPIVWQIPLKMPSSKSTESENSDLLISIGTHSNRKLGPIRTCTHKFEFCDSVDVGCVAFQWILSYTVVVRQLHITHMNYKVANKLCISANALHQKYITYIIKKWRMVPIFLQMRRVYPQIIHSPCASNVYHPYE